METNLWREMVPMTKLVKNNSMNFGKDLAKLRHAAGFTQHELGAEIGVSQRVIAYYESESKHPPANLLPSLARVLNVTTDELLGVKDLVKREKVSGSRMQRKLKLIERLPARDKRQISNFIDAFLERAELKERLG